MIHITQGHERGIGLEVFLKSLLCLPTYQHGQFTLYVYEESFYENLQFLKISANKFKYLNIHFFNFYSHSPSDESLKIALSQIKEKDVLFTLPTSKDQLELEKKFPKGYTEFLRQKFNCESLVMFFHGLNSNVALITDHISLKEVSPKITKSYLENKLHILKKNCPYEIKKYLFLGINPHAGENGLLGTEEKIIRLIGENPIPADTAWQFMDSQTCLISAYHDQGLALFKSLEKFIGINITLGLPFLRLSVDHGTAFNLYSKNCADYTGCLYALKEAMSYEIH